MARRNWEVIRLIATALVTSVLTAIAVGVLYVRQNGEVQRRYMLEYCRAEALGKPPKVAAIGAPPNCSIRVWDGEMVWFDVRGSAQNQLACVVDEDWLGPQPLRDCAFSDAS